MGKPAKVLATTALGLVLAAVGLGAYLRWSLRHMHIELPLAGLLNRLLPQAEIIAIAAGSHGACSSAVDKSSIGDRETEAEMSYVAAMPDLYKSKFGSAPSSMSDLGKLPAFEHADALNNRCVLAGLLDLLWPERLVRRELRPVKAIGSGCSSLHSNCSSYAEVLHGRKKRDSIYPGPEVLAVTNYWDILIRRPFSPSRSKEISTSRSRCNRGNFSPHSISKTLPSDRRSSSPSVSNSRCVSMR